MAIPSYASRDNRATVFRHELKYQINTEQLYTLKHQLSDIMCLDMNTGSDGSYRIRSLYFDDYENTSYYENVNGTQPREKFRIRMYNGSTKTLRLEQKRKEYSKTHKRSCRVTEHIVNTMMEGTTIPWDDEMDPLLKKFYIFQETRLLRPKMIVEYDRIPFVYPDGNVRITLDMNMGACSRVEDFLHSDIFAQPIMPSGKHLMEVKYDGFLPDFIFRSIQNKNLPLVTFSKYYLCRKYGDLL